MASRTSARRTRTSRSGSAARVGRAARERRNLTVSVPSASGLDPRLALQAVDPATNQAAPGRRDGAVERQGTIKPEMAPETPCDDRRARLVPRSRRPGGRPSGALPGPEPRPRPGHPRRGRPSARDARYIGLGEDHDADLGHVLDRPAQAFATDAGVLHAAVWHVVDAVGRHVVDDDATDVEPIERAPGVGQVVREDARLQPVVGVVDAADRLVEVVEPEGDDDRGEGLGRADLRLGRDVGQDGRREEGAIGAAAGDDPAARARPLPRPSAASAAPGPPRPSGRGRSRDRGDRRCAGPSLLRPGAP